MWLEGGGNESGKRKRRKVEITSSVKRTINKNKSKNITKEEGRSKLKER